MGKAKRKGLADKVRSKQKNRSKPQANPFEVKINKVKHTVVNKKVQKWEKGTPGLSRSKAVKRRKDTLLRELHHMKKANSLHDKRIGENDSNLTPDEVMVQRFALERKKQTQKGDFSLNEEEETLTHYGQSLAENLQDTVGSDSENDEGSTMRTGDLQFGGFAKEGEEPSWKDKMKDVIADSKKHKYERQMEKEKAMEDTKELDSNWRAVCSNLQPVQRSEASKKPLTSYLQVFRNLMLEQKSSGGTDKIKTDEERAKEEAEKLKKYEAERLARMRGDEDKPIRKHISADDLNDGFALGDPTTKSKHDANDSEEEKEGLSDDNDSEENDDEKDASENSVDEDEETDDDDREDDYSDLASEGDEDNTSEVENINNKKKSVKAGSGKSCKLTPAENPSGRKDLPFIYTAPGSFEELESLLHGHDSEEQAIILSRLRKCHHPSLAEGNKEKLQDIHLYVLQYFGKLAAQTPLDQKLLGYVSTCVWETMQTFKSVTAVALQKYLTQRQAEFDEVLKRRRGRGLFPLTECLLHLALIENLFPTSDFRHPVCTPALNFMAQVLTECPVKDGQDLVCGLFLCSLALKYVDLSKRYVPEVIVFLHGSILAAVSKTEKQNCIHFPPFRHGSKADNILVLDGNCKDVTLRETWSISELMSKEREHFETDLFRCEAVNFTVDMLLQCVKLWSELPCFSQIIRPLLDLLGLLSTDNYPTSLKRKVVALIQQIKDTSFSKLKVMQLEAKKPEPLKLFEPKIEEFWTGKRKKGGPNRQANERQRLTHKYKREMKAAVREIKRDNEVLAKHQLETTIKRDKERKRKMKDLMHNLATQEGDYKAVKRMKY